ncbi:hypothetical protein QU660_05755 [Stomatobaculum sp. F0698]|uniref:hypothetical protein n=1 Tax=Stomatobaculum sp. F0698 TaxID=3059030 RepID=UPI00272A67C9|nr:hypothetical protein [Stomatobaculum sp. F0698]WLD86015.1 hypothetical protein QU660_05755 [Stomatobaculum sp. F0698]
MSVTSFLHLSETVGEFDLKTFCEEIQKKYPGTDTEQRQSRSLAYDVTWSRYADCPQFELRLDRTRRTLAVEYFNSADRIRDYANLILWIRQYFPKEKEVVLVDENNEAQIPLSTETAIEDIEAWILRVGI